MLAFLLLSRILTPDLNAPVTVQTPNARLTSVMQELSKQSNIPIKVIGAPERDWVYVSFQDRPLNKALDSLAALCDAEWTMQDGKITFRSPWPMKAAIPAWRQEGIDKWLRLNLPPAPLTNASMEKLIFDLRNLRQSDPEGIRAQPLLNSLPITRAHLRLLHAVGAQALAEIPVYQERTYVVQPQGRSFALPRSGAAILTDLAKDRTLCGQELSRRGISYEEFSNWNWRALYAHYDLKEADERFWCLTVRSGAEGLTSQLRGFGGKERFYEKAVDELTIAFSARTPQEDGFEKLTETFEIPEEWRRLAQPEGRAEYREMLARMDKEEFLTSRLPDALKRVKGDVAAIIPDGAFYWAIFDRQNRPTLGSLFRTIYSGEGRYELRGEVSLIRPTDLSISRLNRIPRPEFARYIREITETGESSLDTAAALAVAAENSDSYRHAMAFRGMAFSHSVSYDSEPELLRIYGHLPSSGKQAARGTGWLGSYGQLKPEQRSALDILLDRDGAGLNTRIAMPEVEENTRYSQDYFSDIDLNLPAQIAPATPVLIRFADLRKMYAAEDANGTDAAEVTIDQLAYHKAFMPDHWAKRNTIYFADRSFLQVAADFGAKGLFAATTTARTPTADQKFTIETLPSGLKQEFERLYRGYLRIKGGMSDSLRDPV